ncbi:MAG: sucrase ferredoxin [Actinomycetes bacterium]
MTTPGPDPHGLPGADEHVRCAPFHESLGVPPWGSTAAYEGFLFVEVPLPWPHDVTEAAPFAGLSGKVAPLVEAADGRRWRPQALVPRAGATDVEVLAFDRPAGPARPFRRRSWSAAPDAVPTLCRAVLDAGWDGAVQVEGAVTGPPVEGTELFVCTHGKRDTCCGSLGTRLFEALAGRPELAGSVRRTSHTGGHRFAPTVLSFPDGYAWAHVDTPYVGRQLGAGDGELARAHCRGSAGFDDPAAQVVDVEGFAALGAAWAVSVRTATVSPLGDETWAVSVESVLDDQVLAVVTATVRVDRVVPQPVCGAVSLAAAGTATAPVLAARDVTVSGEQQRPAAG